jgi:hypothetical protein
MCWIFDACNLASRALNPLVINPNTSSNISINDDGHRPEMKFTTKLNMKSTLVMPNCDHFVRERNPHFLWRVQRDLTWSRILLWWRHWGNAAAPESSSSASRLIGFSSKFQMSPHQALGRCELSQGKANDCNSFTSENREKNPRYISWTILHQKECFAWLELFCLPQLSQGRDKDAIQIVEEKSPVHVRFRSLSQDKINAQKNPVKHQPLAKGDGVLRYHKVRHQ